jgi:GH24 family phage-related lysozyme (muramidase)
MDRDRLFNQLKYDEGIKYEIYNDHLGYPTFGIGHLITEDDPEYGMPIGTPITESRVAVVFNEDVDTAITECKALYGDSEWALFPGEVQEILVNMMFNLGRTRLRKFKRMNHALLQHDWKIAAIEGRDSLWYNQVPHRAERLMSRLELIG